MIVPRSMPWIFLRERCAKIMVMPDASSANSGMLARSQACARASRSRWSREDMLRTTTVMRVADFATSMRLLRSHAEGKRELIEQQILRGEFGIVRYPVEGRIVAVHVLVQALHDVREGPHVAHLGLLPVPFCEGVDFFQVCGVGDAAFAPRFQRVFQEIETGQVLGDEIRVAPVFDSVRRSCAPTSRSTRCGECR